MWTVVTMGKDELRESSRFSMYVLVYCLSRFQSACLEILFCENENNLTKKKKVAGHPPHPPAHALLVPVHRVGKETLGSVFVVQHVRGGEERRATVERKVA